MASVDPVLASTVQEIDFRPASPSGQEKPSCSTVPTIVLQSTEEYNENDNSESYPGVIITEAPDEAPECPDDGPVSTSVVEIHDEENNEPEAFERLLLPRFYAGDVVLLKENKRLPDWMPMFGTVLKPDAESEMGKSPDKGSSDEFHVHWDYTNRIALTKSSSVALVDRVLLRGQTVMNSEREIGTVSGYDVTASVLINGTDYIVQNVPLSRLRPITPFVRGQEIMFMGWAGIITSVKRNVWFRLANGLVFYIEINESDGFQRVDPYWGLGVACPGMRVRLPASAFKRAQWTSRSVRFFSRFLPLQRLFAWSYSTITRTEVTELQVKWLQPVPGTPENLKPRSSTLNRQALNHLLVIGTPSTETVGINSVRKLKVLPNDDIMKYGDWMEQFKHMFVDGFRSLGYLSKKANDFSEIRNLLTDTESETPVRVLLRHNTVSVSWKNGSVEKVPAISIPGVAVSVDDGEFPMGLTVAPVEKNSSDGDKYGIVMASLELAKAKSRLVNVRWMVNGKDAGVEAVPVFDLRPHDVYSLYDRGTILFPRPTSVTSTKFLSAVVVDLNVEGGKMVVMRCSDNVVDEVYPHQVVALEKRCHWSFYSRTWVLDDMLPSIYHIDMDYSQLKRLVDVNSQRWDLLMDDPNNPPIDDSTHIPTLWDEPAFDVLAYAPETHRYYFGSKPKVYPQDFTQVIKKEMDVLKESGSLPEGIWLRFYENRLDLISALMVGPSNTPYEDGLFLFDLQLPPNFPRSMPAVHYISYTQEIHPQISFDGNVCTKEITWNPFEETASSHIHCFLSRLQTLIFTPSPYFAHLLIVDKEAEVNSENGQNKARFYNQNTFVRVLDTLWNMVQNPHAPWEKSIRSHYSSSMPEKFAAIEKWINGEVTEDSVKEVPMYPLFPVPEGVKLAVQKRVDQFKKLQTYAHQVKLHGVTDTTADSESYHVQEPVDRTKLLTPIAEITEPSSTSTFGTKLSSITVPSDTEGAGHPHTSSLDSLKNVKESGKHSRGTSESESEVKQESNSNKPVVDFIKNFM